MPKNVTGRRGDISCGEFLMWMSFLTTRGEFVVMGNTATVLQLIIIGILIYLLYGAAYAVVCPEKQESIP
jgi:hypothetical protein